MNGLDLFSGIGGISLALEPWVRTVAYCENDRYAQAVLLSRMRDGRLPVAPIWDDVRTLKGNMLPEIDIIFGGFPCQDISVAGHGIGLGGSRSGLFWEIHRLVKELRPRFIFLENVPAIRTRGLNAVAQALTELRYDCRWTIVSAAEVGACHLRKRWFMLAHANCEPVRIQSNGISECETQTQSGFNESPRRDTDAHGAGLERGRGSKSKITRPAIYNGWSAEPVIRGGNNGILYRVDRTKCLGNSVVPLQARKAFEKLIGVKT